MQTCLHYIKGAVALCNLSRILSRNFVATQVAREIAKCNMPGNHKVMRDFVARSIARSRIKFYTFRSDCRSAERIFQTLHSVTSFLQFVLFVL